MVVCKRPAFVQPRVEAVGNNGHQLGRPHEGHGQLNGIAKTRAQWSCCRESWWRLVLVTSGDAAAAARSPGCGRVVDPSVPSLLTHAKHPLFTQLKQVVLGGAPRRAAVDAEGCPWDESTCAHATRRAIWRCFSGHICQRLPLGCEYLFFCRFGGHLDVLQWAHANDCHWDEDVCRTAALFNRFEVLKWAYDNGCSWDHTYVKECTLFPKRQAILQWVREIDGKAVLPQN